MTYRFYLTLVRHGETMENRENIIQGQSDTVLSELGRKQASLVAERLQGERFTHMFTSDLSRARSTAEAIAQANMQSTCTLVSDERLRERSFGVMEGKRFSDLQELLKDKVKSFKSYTPERGESIGDVTKRAASFFDSICDIVAMSAYGSCSNDGSSCQAFGGPSQCTGAAEQDPSQTGQEESAVDFYPQNSSSSIGQENDLSLSHSNGCGTDKPSPKSDLDLVNILIVSHGLMLKELKSQIINRYVGQPNDKLASSNHRVSPNTGVSIFEMSVSKEAGEVCVKCVDCCVLDCKAHLSSSIEDLVTEAKYQSISNT